MYCKTNARQEKPHGNVVDISGCRFGRLLAISLNHAATYMHYKAMWNCVCDCGAKVVKASNSLRMGGTRSCGCLRKELVGAIRRKHMMSNTSIYTTWASMIKRCGDHKYKKYADYGGRGIKVCDRWHEFANFYADVGDKPSGMELERIDNNGNYEPSNVRWATRSEQMRNTRNNRYVEYGGRRLTISEWSLITGLRPQTIGKRIKRGWSAKDALTQPSSWEKVINR